jgi:hypothetical protein
LWFGTHRTFRTGILTLILAFAAVISALGVGTAKADELPLFEGVTTLIAPYSPNPTVQVDGTMSSGEYDSSVTWTTPDTGISISMIHDNYSLYVAVEGPAWGSVAVGISSDGATTMGFVLVANTGNGYQATERISDSVAESMTLSPSANPKAIKDFEVAVTADHVVAELKLSLDSALWTLGPGVVYPTVVATNLTSTNGFPTTLSGDSLHFMGTYLLRQEDNTYNVNQLLNGDISPVPSVVAVVILSAGVLAILFEFVVRRRPQ